MLPSIIGVLEWRDMPFLLCYLASCHSARVDDELKALLAGDAPEIALLSAAWQSLPETSRDRIRMAPETVNQLRRRTPATLAFLKQSIFAERRQAGATDDFAEPLWTALGDAYLFPVGCGEAWTAPRLCSGLAVDIQSPSAKLALSIDANLSRFPTPSEHHQIVVKLDDATRTIGAIAPPALTLLLAVTRVIVLGAGSGPDMAFSSFSHHRWPGRSGFGNAQLTGINFVTICDALVHEAIHSFLYLVEEHYPLLIVGAERAEVKLQSPWTGRALSLRSFVHAIFVWFGLWQFWRRASSVVPDNHAQTFMRVAEVGFHDRNLLEQLRGANHLITDQARLAAKLPGLVVGS